MRCAPPMRSAATPTTNAAATTTTPTHGRQRHARASRAAPVRALRQPLERELRAARRETGGRRGRAHDLGRGAARPRAIGVGPAPCARGRRSRPPSPPSPRARCVHPSAMSAIAQARRAGHRQPRRFERSAPRRQRPAREARPRPEVRQPGPRFSTRSSAVGQRRLQLPVVAAAPRPAARCRPRSADRCRSSRRRSPRR